MRVERTKQGVHGGTSPEELTAAGSLSAWLTETHGFCRWWACVLCAALPRVRRKSNSARERVGTRTAKVKRRGGNDTFEGVHEAQGYTAARGANHPCNKRRSPRTEPTCVH